MDIVILILAILFLVGCPVGKALAICTIVEVGILTFAKILKKIGEKRGY